MKTVLDVLLIEDNPADVRLITEKLGSVASSLQVQVERAGCLQLALERLASRMFEAVLVTIDPPDPNGLDTLRAVLRAVPQIPVIAITPLPGDETGMKALQAGAQDYLSKGEMDGELLLHMIRNSICRKQAELQRASAVSFTEQVVSSSPMGILTYRLSGECLSANQAASQMIGGTREQLCDQNFHRIESWRSSGLYDMAMQTIRTRRPVVGDVHLLSSFGRELWYTAHFALFPSNDEDLLMLVMSEVTERKRAETALQNSEHFINETLDALTSHIAILDETGTIVAVNRPWREFAQANGVDPLLVSEGVNYLAVCDAAAGPSAEEAGAVAAGIRAVMQGDQESFSMEYASHSPDARRWFIVRVTRFREASPVRVVVAHEVITERKEAEAALAASEKRFRAWIENSSDILTVLDAGGVIQYESPSLKRILDYEPEELLGKNAFDFIHPDDQDRVIATFMENIQNPTAAAAAEFRFLHRDGSWRYLEGIGRAYVDEHDEVVGLVHSRDMTERKLAEKTLEEKERLLSEAQRIGRIGSWSYDIAADSMTFSDEMYRLLDILPDEFAHNREHFLALIYPSDRPLAAEWMSRMKTGTQAKDLQFRIFHRGGELRYLHCSGVVEFGSEVKPARFIGTIQDVTERRTAEIQIGQQIRRLTALSEIDRAILSSFDQSHTLGVILANTIAQLQVDASDILILDPDSEVLDFAAGQGFRTRLMEAAHIPIGESYAGQAARERRMIRVPDLRESATLPAFREFAEAEGFVSYLCVPLIVKGNVKGVLEVFQRSMLQPYQEWLDFFNALAGQTAIAIDNTSLFANLQTTNSELVRAYDATIEGWSRAMDLRDRETEGHTQRVTKLTLQLAGSLGMDESALMHIRRGALLHDIGKLGVPDHILFKPGRLTPEEREIIEKHVDFAYEMLAPIPYLKPALNIPYFHHEKWDGTGYPLGLKGDQIPMESRIFALVDVWDALLSDRPYRKAWSRDETIQYIRAQAGIHFDPRVVESFLDLVEQMGESRYETVRS